LVFLFCVCLAAIPPIAGLTIMEADANLFSLNKLFNQKSRRNQEEGVSQ
jgi:hypothetical protein